MVLARRLLIVGGGSGLALPEDEVFHGVRAEIWDGTVPLGQTVANNTFWAVRYIYTGPSHRAYDTDNYHPVNTESNLTGTVAKTASSATIVGTGTAFLSELAVGTPVRIVGGEHSGYVPEVFVVTAITDNTHFTASHAAGASASGVTAVKDASAFVVQAGMAGYYAGHIASGWRADADGIREINVCFNGMQTGFDAAGSNSNMDEQVFSAATSAGEHQETMPWGPVYLDEYDFVQAIVYQSSGGSLDLAADLPGLPFSMWRVGTT